jgi:hypothetical protein
MKRIFSITALMFFLFLWSLPAASPTLIVGTFIDTGAYKVEGTEGRQEIDFGLSGNMGYRFSLGNRGYTVLNGGVLLSGIRAAAESGGKPFDSEYLDLKMMLPAGDNSVEFDSSVEASLLGGAAGGTGVAPSWELRYRFERGRRKVRPYIGYIGDYRYRETGDSGRYSSGAAAGFDYSPLIEKAWALEVKGLWERYGEQQNTDGDVREDLLITLAGKGDFIPALFWNFSVSPSFTYRTSTMEGKAALEMEVPASVGWTPLRWWSFQLDAAARPVHYLESGETDASWRGSLRIDRSFEGGLFFYLEGGGSGTVSEAAMRESWEWFVRLGVDISF